MPASSVADSLSDFLRTHSGDILRSWDEFASTVPSGGATLDAQELRDHAAEILTEIAADMDRFQSEAQQRAKSRGDAAEPAAPSDSAAQTHADTRISAGFAILPMMTEYRALRASVLHLWGESRGGSTSEEVTQITRFNEAIDQALIESAARYTQRTKQNTDLFIGVLGHDIRNPLATIAMSVHVLSRSGRLDQAAARPILNSVARIQSVIEQIVDFTRAQAGTKMPLSRTPGDLAEYAEEIVEELQVAHPEASLVLERGSGNFQGKWDKGRIGQLLSNLLGNAVSYGDRSAPITVRLDADDSDVKVIVGNRGPVIPPDECERIFEPLVRGVTAEEVQAKGLGLGLYVCREVVRAHDGGIEVRSDADEGTRFIIRLPREAAEQKASEARA